MANTTIYPYGTNGQLPSSIGVINDLTTGGADKALSAEMGKELNIDVNGFDFVGTWHGGAWGGTTSLSIGGTYAPNAPATDYGSVVNYRYCEKFTVKAGEQYHIITKCNQYNRNIVITTIDGEVVYLGALDANVANYTTSFEYDVIVYVNAHKDFTDKIVSFSVKGHEQRIATLEKATAAMFSPFSFVEGQSTYLPLMRGLNPYPNTSDHFMELTYATNSSSVCYTPWLAMPHGTYILPSMNFRVYQSDSPKFHGDYVNVGENIWSTTLSLGGIVEVTHDYVMFVILGQSSSADLATLASVYCDSVVSYPVARQNKAHVAHQVSTGDYFFIYLPIRDKYYCFQLTRYSASGRQLVHYGISDVYFCENANYSYPQTKLTRDSEYECAINVQNQGYLGGHMHGYEQMVDADTTIYINGQSKTLSDAFGEDVTGMFEMMQHSILYKTDKTTKVADIYKRWRVVGGKLHLYNRVVFAASYHIERAQFSMFGILRREGASTSNPYLTCFASRNSDTRVYQTTDGWDTSSPTDGASIISTPAKATLQEQWGESGYIVRQEIFENNQKENGGMFINSNGGGEYNKMYFEIGSNFDVVEGDELFSHAVLSIE